MERTVVRAVGGAGTHRGAMDIRALGATRTARVWLAVGAVLATATVGGAMATRGPSAPVAAAIPAVAAPGPATTLLVYVSGAVAHPGLYELAAGARVADAVAAAGGLLATADPAKMPNMAALLHDGHQVNVPFLKTASPTVSVKFDVNTATVDELEEIPGMTPALAQAIVDARTQWGPFASLADLRTTLELDSATATLIGRHLTFTTSLQ